MPTIHTHPADARQSFAEYAEHFLSVKSRSCRPYTIRTYRNELAIVNRFIGGIPLEHITENILNDYYQAMQSSVTVQGKAYSPAYIRHSFTLIRMVMSLAVKEGLLRENPADQDHIPLPKADRKEKDVLDAEEAREFARCALAENDPRTKLMVILYLYTGMRMDELCGLEWKDVDFAEKTISIQRTSVYVPGKRLVTKEMEDMDGRRVIEANPLVSSVLQEYRNWYLGQQERKSGEWVHSDRMFVRSDGSPVTPNSTALWLDKFTARWNLRRVTSLTLRSACSILQPAAGAEGVE